jgi:AcrR family transcriptional regulator
VAVKRSGGRPRHDGDSGVDRRTALLNAAIEQIATRGTRGMRVDEVAKAAGASTALVYHHFGDRSSLLIAALEHIGERANTYTAASAGTAHEMLLAVLVNEIQDDRVVRMSSAAWGELRDTAIFDEALRPTLAILTNRWIDDIADLVRAGSADGGDASIVTILDPTVAGIRLTALVEGLSSRWLAGLLTTDEARLHLVGAARAVLEGPVHTS